MPDIDLPIPTYAHNMRLIGHSDQGGRSDGQQIIVHRGYAYIGHVCSRGFSVVDVRDPTRPRVVNYIENPPNTWSLHLQVHDDLLLLVHARDMFAQPDMADERNYYKPKPDFHAHNDVHQERNWSAGMAVFDISSPETPRQIGFMPVAGGGLHRIWYVGGRWAYASALFDGFTDYVKVGGHLGPHNIHENRPGSFVSSELIFATYQNAGVRIYDIRDQYRPVEVGAMVPPAPLKLIDPRPNRPVVLHSADVFVDANRIIYCTDWSGAGLYIMDYTG